MKAEDELDIDGAVEEDLGKSRDGSRTDDEVVQRWVTVGTSGPGVFAALFPRLVGLNLSLTMQSDKVGTLGQPYDKSTG